VPQNQVFISYSHKDRKWRDDFETHLKPYLRGGSVVSWSDQQIAPGSEWFKEIQSALANSKVAVLLVSPDFLASDFIHEHELGPLLKEAEQGGVKILWVPIRDSAYKQTPLKKYQAVLHPSKPLATWPKAKRDQTWVKICEEIKKAVNSPHEVQEPPHESAPIAENPLFEKTDHVIIEIVIKTSPITSPWRHSSSRRVIRMPLRFLQAEGFSWNARTLRANGFQQLLLHKARLDSENQYNFALENLHPFHGDLGSLGQPCEVGDGCQLWILPDPIT